MSNVSKDWPPRENWISDGNEEPVQEGYLVGDRKGLETLRRAIDAALASEDGEASIEELRCQWSHVRVCKQHPQEEQKDVDRSPMAKAWKYLVLGVLGAALFLLIYGCTQLPRLFK
jgi:hypothetical protein